jgi:hypothetical protein
LKIILFLNRNRKKTEPLKKEKNRDPGSRSGIGENLSRIRGVKKAPDLGFAFATLELWRALDAHQRLKVEPWTVFFMLLFADSHHF